MSAITWTRHMFTGIADRTERAAWYTAAGLDTWFSQITVPSDGKDVMTFKPNPNGYSITLTWSGMNTTTPASSRYLNTVGHSNPAGSTASAVNIPKSSSDWASSTNGEICFDTAKVGDIDLLRICLSEAPSKHIIFAKDACKTADNTDCALYAMCNSFWSGSATATLSGAVMLLNTANAGESLNTASSGTVAYLSDSYGYTDKYILRPIISKGVMSHLYSMDGGDTVLAGNTEFMLDKKTWYSLGHGVVLKVK